MDKNVVRLNYQGPVPIVVTRILQYLTAPLHWTTYSPRLVTFAATMLVLRACALGCLLCSCLPEVAAVAVEEMLLLMSALDL